MRLVNAETIILGDPTTLEIPTEEAILKRLEEVGRTCYQSTGSESSSEGFIRGIIKRGHLSILEHVSLTVRFQVDRGITHELVRHRMASMAQESTRYCNFSQDRFGSEVTYINLAEGVSLDPTTQKLNEETKLKILGVWLKACEFAEESYMQMLYLGASPQIARSVLNNSTKSTIILTQNIRQWRHFLSLRAIGTTGSPHPQMLEVTRPLYQKFVEHYPTLFGDLDPTALGSLDK